MCVCVGCYFLQVVDCSGPVASLLQRWLCGDAAVDNDTDSDSALLRLLSAFTSHDPAFVELLRLLVLLADIAVHDSSAAALGGPSAGGSSAGGSSSSSSSSSSSRVTAGGGGGGTSSDRRSVGAGACGGGGEGAALAASCGLSSLCALVAHLLPAHFPLVVLSALTATLSDDHTVVLEFLVGDDGAFVTLFLSLLKLVSKSLTTSATLQNAPAPLPSLLSSLEEVRC